MEIDDRKVDDCFRDVLDTVWKLHLTPEEVNTILYNTYSTLYQVLKIAYANKHKRSSGGNANEKAE